jgi:ABC-type lipoprotein export system ATPase subunit
MLSHYRHIISVFGVLFDIYLLLGIRTIGTLWKKKKRKKIEKTILKDLSFVLKPRTMTAILGGPSSGKTTMLDFIALRRSVG